MRTHFEAKGLRPYIRNWPSVARNLMTKVRLRLLEDPRNEVATGIVRDFGDEVSALPAPNSGEDVQHQVAFTIELALGNAKFRYQTLFAALDDPRDRTAAALRIEAFIPADEATRACFERLHRAAPAQ